MRDYRRMMEQVTLSDQKKEEIMEMIENKNTAKRHMPKAAKIVLAAALAAQVYHFVAGGSVVVEPGGAEVNFTLTGDEVASPVTVEDGRLVLNVDGQKLDITDKVDEDTPYVQERTDPATGNKGYLVVGGTVEDYGWAEFFLTEDGTCSMTGENAWDNMVPVNGEYIPLTQLTEDQIDALNESDDNLMRTVYRPWLDKAVAQLDLEVALGIVD